MKIFEQQWKQIQENKAEEREQERERQIANNNNNNNNRKKNKKKQGEMDIDTNVDNSMVISPEMQNQITHIRNLYRECQSLFFWYDGPLVTSMKKGEYFLIDEISLAGKNTFNCSFFLKSYDLYSLHSSFFNFQTMPY